MLADDFPQWRRYLISRLQDELDLEIVCVAADELEAIQKANELQPDLILIGIGLHKENGIEAARQIHKLAPKTKILMLSQDLDPAAARAALSSGAHGYVFKADSPLELMPAVRAVMLGKQFVSWRFVGVNVSDSMDT
jgi:DNA-binding NarL/FixJ family response regulator